MSVFDDLIGQSAAVAVLRAAVAAAADGRQMTHAWLFTGPPGSGRSVAARAFAAALQCPHGGCGECPDCRAVAAGNHPDVDQVVPEGLHLTIDEARRVVGRAARAPVRGRWQVILIEDADRMEERTSNTLLKAVEEPSPHGVFLLCAPAADDLLPTIRSRCRLVPLRIPPVDAVAEFLVSRHGVDPAVAAFAARAAHAHVGRARRLAMDERARNRRREALQVAGSVASVPACLVTAANLVAAAEEDAAQVTEPMHRAEAAAVETAFGEGTGRGARRAAQGAWRDLERRQKSRSTRAQRDALDRALTDLASFYRDVLVVQFGDGSPAVPLVNPDVATEIEGAAAAAAPEGTLRRLLAVLDCREAIEANVAPLLAAEAMTLALRDGGTIGRKAPG
jgi:DNA polymerase-3 subunit delta'